MAVTAVSAPGKVLLAGGYLVLDRKHTGLSFGLDARIHIHAAAIDQEAGEDVIVRSPQFEDAVWRFTVGDDYSLKESEGKRNPFVQTAISYALAYAATVTANLQKRITITIMADDAYYSDERRKTSPSDRFSSFGIPIEDVHKTGLGSSAALVTSLVAAVLLQSASDSQVAIQLRQGEASSVRKLHNLAQAAHCEAQGKVGSGFDVASAVYGSCKYRRFSPAILDAVSKPGDSNFSKDLCAVIDEAQGSRVWDYVVDDTVAVPAGLKLVMCDVDCGSQTPGMVRDVLAWRTRSPKESAQLWSELQARNDAFAVELDKLAKDGSTRHQMLRKHISAIRASIRQMTLAANVPIEPAEQTKLIDACSEVPGVIGGVVPGAGGYDAVALLIEDKAKVLAELSAFLGQYSYLQPGSLATGKVGLLDVKGETEGLRIERADSYKQWLMQ